jgi:hypothetical protein
MIRHTNAHTTIALEPHDQPQNSHRLLCPSAQPDWNQAAIFGVVGGTSEEPRVAYLTEPQLPTPELLALTHPVRPTEVLRIAAPCVGHDCQHFDGTQCQLVARTVIHLQPVVEKLPACTIRVSCRWWNEQGKAACLRCPQVITDSFTEDPDLRLAATPDNRSNHL